MEKIRIIERTDSLISRKLTGTAKVLSHKLDMSRSNVFRIIYSVLIFFILLIFYSPFAFSQNSNNRLDIAQDRANINSFDSLLATRNFKNAIDFYKKNVNCDLLCSRTRHLGISELANSLGETKLAKKELIKAVKKGAIWHSIFNDRFLDLYEYINSFNDEIFADSIFLYFNKISKDKMESSIPLRFRYIEKHDQKIRNDMQYKKCIDIYYKYAFSDNKDTFDLDSTTLNCAMEFRKKDSIIIQSFIDIIDSLGFVPSDKQVFGFAEINALVVHTAYFNYSPNLDSIYLNSIMLGTLSPRTYAWYKGYREEFTHSEQTYYYTHRSNDFNALKLSKNKVNQINNERHKIGLPLLPHNVWEMFYATD